jgi:plasmid stability protein
MPATTATVRGRRVAAAFDYVVARASRKLPWLSDVKLRYCRSVDAEHRRKWRQFMHSNERRMTVCVAKAAEVELTDDELVGMSLHEVGHVTGTELEFPEHIKPNRGKETSKAVQREADWIVRHVLQAKIRYNSRTLQEFVSWLK